MFVEKDPRNLVILFNSIPIILSNFPLGPFVEDFFEVLSCYFPIDFSPVRYICMRLHFTQRSRVNLS
jgi:hypothetical protein